MADQPVRSTLVSYQIARRTALVLAAVLTFAAAAAILWLASTAVLAILVGILFAVLFDAGARGLGRLVGWDRRYRLALVFFLFAFVIGAAIWWGGTTVTQQASQFVGAMQDLFRQLGKLLAENGLGTPGQESVDVSSLLPSPGAIFGGATKVASSLFEAVTIAAAVLFLGTFFAWEPEVYKAALLSILPADRRQRVDQVLDQAAHAMREWMLGQSVSMAVIFLFSLAALLLVQMPYPILLAVQAGLLGFIPTIGPFIAGVVIILAGLSQSHHRPLRPGNLCGVPISRIALGHPDGAGTHDPAAARFYPRNTAHCGSPVWAPRGGIFRSIGGGGQGSDRGVLCQGPAGGPWRPG